jgi:putative hydrolase of the HAD superfamily
MREHVAFLPGAQDFLQALVDRGVRTVLVTNAHPDSLAIKAAQTSLKRYFESLVSSHELGVPKEHDDFWPRLAARLRYDPARTLFVDDSVPVLRAARRHGIAHLFMVLKPDTTQGRRPQSEFAGVDGVVELL